MERSQLTMVPSTNPELIASQSDDMAIRPSEPPAEGRLHHDNETQVTAPLDDLISDDDTSSGMREYTGVFEGPEKTLEVCFRKKEENVVDTPDQNGRIGLRQLSRANLDRVCERAKCTIMSSVSNQYLDAYVLSESSLFVYPYMMVLKTCGTTTLLRCIAILIKLGHRLGLEIDWVGYSRKNFNFPGDQCFPHQSFLQELEYLNSHKSLCDRLNGNGYTLGPLTADHWFVYVADNTIRAHSLETDTDRVLNIMMFDIDEDVANVFMYENYDTDRQDETKDEEAKRISREQTRNSGIDVLCPGAIIDDRAFEPCGYSMNAILFKSYSTIHITPESGSSYVSFETNQKVSSYRSLVNNVLRTFRPKRFIMTLMADELGLDELKENPLAGPERDSKFVIKTPRDVAKATGAKQMAYKRNTLASIQVEHDCCCMMGTWKLKDPINPVEIAMRSSKHRGMSMS